MDLYDMIEGEYSLFLKGKLPFEIIYPDNYQFIIYLGLFKPSKSQVEFNRRFVREYRIELLRTQPLFLHDEFKTLDREPSTREARQEAESKIRAMLLHKSLVYDFYESQKLMNKKRIFPELLPEKIPKQSG